MEIKKDVWYRVIYKDNYYENGEASFTCKNEEVKRALAYLKKEGLEFLRLEEVKTSDKLSAVDDLDAVAQCLNIDTSEYQKTVRACRSESIEAEAQELTRAAKIDRKGLGRAIEQALEG